MFFSKKPCSCFNQLMSILYVTQNLRLDNHKSPLWADNLLIHISELMKTEKDMYVSEKKPSTSD